MMVKKEVVDKLRMARSAHVQWRARAQALVAGIPLEKEQVPVAYTDCKFGKWYYGSGQDLSSLDAFKAIEEPHQQLHLIYMKIFAFLFGEDNRSFLSKMFGSTKRYKQENLEQAKELLPHLIGVSETLLEAIDLLEKDLQRMSDADMKALSE